MAYIRCDKDCNPTVQPGNINVIDTFGNSNDFFHVDYKKKDKDNNVIPHRDPNDPQNTTYPTNPDVLFFDTNWTRRLSDNSAGVKRQYVQGLYFPTGGTYPPGHPDVGSGTYTVKPTDIYTSTLPEPIYLAAESDDDLWITDEAGDDIITIMFTNEVEIIPN